MGLFSADRIVINPPATTPAPTPPAQPCGCPPPVVAQPAPTPSPAAPTPSAPTPPVPATTPPVVVVQNAADQGAYDLNGRHYMSPFLMATYANNHALTATGQAHLLTGATDAQLIEDYRNGDVSASVLTVYKIPVPKGMVQIKQSPVSTSPDFPAISGTDPPPYIVPGSSWTFNVPSGWSYSISTSTPMQRQALPASPDPKLRPPQNLLFVVDVMRSTQTVKTDGSTDVTVAANWVEILPRGADGNFMPLPAGTYSALITATLYPSDNPPPSA